MYYISLYRIRLSVIELNSLIENRVWSSLAVFICSSSAEATDMEGEFYIFLLQH
jgi:hypothetical protein